MIRRCQTSGHILFSYKNTLQIACRKGGLAHVLYFFFRIFNYKILKLQDLKYKIFSCALDQISSSLDFRCPIISPMSFSKCKKFIIMTLLKRFIQVEVAVKILSFSPAASPLKQALAIAHIRYSRASYVGQI